MIAMEHQDTPAPAGDIGTRAAEFAVASVALEFDAVAIDQAVVLAGQAEGVA